MTLGEFRKTTKGLPGDLKLFRVTGDHNAYQIHEATCTFVEKWGQEYFEYFSDADMGAGATKERAIVIR